VSLVLDNSVAIEWLIAADPQAAAARLVRRHDAELLVPSIFWIELIYVFGKHIKRGWMDRPFRDQCLRRLRRFDPLTDLEAAAPGPALDRALSLGDQTGTTVYDAVYLELALRSSSPLATFDAGLARAARSLGVGVIDA